MDAVPFTLSHNFDCFCGKNHSFNTEVYIEAEALRAFVALMPKGARVLYVGDSQRVRETLLRFYRTDTFSPATGLLSSLNCPPVTLSSTDQLVRLMQTPAYDDLKMIAGSGKGASTAKFLAHKLGLRLILFGGDNLSEYSYVRDKEGFFSLIRARCNAIILFEHEVNLPQGFAGVLNTLLSIFDWEISALLYGDCSGYQNSCQNGYQNSCQNSCQNGCQNSCQNGNEGYESGEQNDEQNDEQYSEQNQACPFIIKEAKKAVVLLLNAAKQYTRHSPQLKKALIKAQLRLAVLSSYCGSGALFTSGAYQAASALSLLMLNEDRQSKSIAENAFMFAPVTAKIYASFLSSISIFSPPPDNNLRLGKISEYLGIDETRAQGLMADYFCRKDLERADYRLNLYKDQLKAHINWLVKILDTAYGLFFKLYPDDGFCLRGYLDSLDVSLCIGLGADILHGRTLLSYMRHKGLLDKYIL